MNLIVRCVADFYFEYIINEPTSFTMFRKLDTKKSTLILQLMPINAKSRLRQTPKLMAIRGQRSLAVIDHVANPPPKLPATRGQHPNAKRRRRQPYGRLVVSCRKGRLVFGPRRV